MSIFQPGESYAYEERKQDGEILTPQFRAARERFRRRLTQLLRGQPASVMSRHKMILIHHCDPFSDKPTWLETQCQWRICNQVPKAIDAVLRANEIEFQVMNDRAFIRIEVDQVACPQPMRRQMTKVSLREDF